MIRLSRFQRLALLAASTTVITAGVLSQGSAFAAPAAPRTAAVTAAHRADADTQWKQIDDTASGVTVRLPGKPDIQKDTTAGVAIRDYLVTTGYGATGFSVYDKPDAATGPWDLDGGLKAALDGYNSVDAGAELTSTDVHHGTTHDGDHYVEAKLVGVDGKVGHIRIVDLGKHSIMLMTVGRGGQQAAVDRDYQQVLDSIKVPHHGAPRAEASAVST
ncbi:hypothetical protein AB0L75_09735 [Streptomyces sp. NPDC052101]|uniref:hypothetical protein n=1 Tax=Streptomyces sp. NPDC052101 TaxID=3155763 RepID=UPI00342194BE